MRILRIIGWLIVLDGVLLGTLVIAVVGGTAVGEVTYTAAVIGIIAGLISIIASLTAMHNPRAAARMNLCAAPLAPLLVIAFSWEFGGFLESVAVVSGAIILPACFWYIAGRRSWPLPLSSSFFSRHRAAAIVSGAGICFVSLAAAFVWSLSLPWWPPIYDCSGGPILDEQGHPFGIDFTAKIFFIGPRTFHGNSLWAIARVEERFSPSSESPSSIVILRSLFRPSDLSDEYFIEGSRSGLLTRFLPVIERQPCARSGTRERAAVALRILRDGPPKTGVRLIGRVYNDLAHDQPVAGVPVSIEGPSKTSVATTDALGVYDVSGLPPGHYRVHLAQQRSTVVETDLKAGEVGEWYFNLR